MEILNPEEHFYLKDGQVIKTLGELQEAANSMTSEVFSHHANTDKNDFHNWVRDVHGQDVLAKRIANAKDGPEMATLIKEHVAPRKIGIVEQVISKKKVIVAKKVKKKVAPIRHAKDTEKVHDTIEEHGPRPIQSGKSCNHSICMMCGIKNFLMGIGIGILAGLLLAMII